MPEIVNIEINRGDSFDMALRFKDEQEDPINITDVVVVFTIKEKTYRPDTDAQVTKTVTIHDSPEYGETHVHLTPAETASLSKGVYDYDLQMHMPNGDIKTIIYGKINFVVDSNW